MAGTSGNAASVTFEVTTPTLASTRAVGDGNTATKLYVGVYEYQNGELAGPLDVSLIDDKTVTFTDRVATVNLALVKNKKYSVVFWAETQDNTEAMFDIDWQGRELTLKSELYANQEKYDAFWAQEDIEINGAISKTVMLTRPFAQLNIGTSDKAQADAAGVVVGETQVVVKGVYNTFNLQTGEASGAADVTYAMAAIDDIESENFPAHTDPVQSYLSLNYLLMTADKSTIDVAFSYMDKEDETAYEMSFTSVPVQRNYRTNIYGTLLTNSANYTVEILPGFGQNGEEDAANIVYAKTAEEVAAALTADEENIEVRLLNDIELPITSLGTQTGGSGEYKLGSENTENITIDLGGKKLTITTTYWSVLGAKNDNALFTIKNGTMTSSQVSGTWNSYDLDFANCNYAIENVIFEKAIAFTSGAEKNISVKDVTINETHDYYGMWISAKGQVVDIENLTINSAGRGIKIDEEYVKEKTAKVTMNVNNLAVKSEKKAAIVVKSVEGAEITLANVDLSGVKADGLYAVWVDEDSKDYADKVSVTGGFVKVEGAENNAETNPFLVENGTVELPAGTFVMPTAVANGLTIVGATDGTTVLDMTGANPSYNKNLTFENVTINVSTKLYHGMQHTSGLTYNNCVINGTLFLYSTAEFNDCTFNVEGDNYNVWTYGSTEATFNGCRFNCDGKSVLVYNEGGNGSVITMNRCSFIANQAVEGKSAVEIDSSLLPEGKTYVVNLNDCEVQGFGKGSVSNEMLFNHKKGTKASIYVNGAKAVSTEAELIAAIAAANNQEFTKIALTSKTFSGAFDIDGKSVEIVALNRHQAIIDGLVHGLNYAHITISGITLTNANPAASTSSRHNADYYCLGAYVADFLIEDCVFNVSNEGNAADKGAINIYACRDDYELYDGYNLTVKNTVFNCKGERPIRGKTDSWIEGCTFNDQHRYAIQVQGNNELSAEAVMFVNNTINNPCMTSGEKYAAGVSISKSQLLEDAAFNISGNKITGTSPTELKFVYDDHDNVKITTCTLNGETITEGQCIAFAEADDAKEVLDEEAYTVNENVYTIYSAKGMLWFANEVNVNGNKFDGITVKLGANIDLSDIDWEPIGQTGKTTFNGVFDGQNFTISNLNVDSEDQTGAHYSSGLFGWVETHTEGKGQLKNVKISGATIKGHHNCGALVGYITEKYAIVENCHVSDATINCTNANNDADGDKAGALIGNATNATTVKDCTATNSTVSSGRDAGQLIGAAKGENVTGCSATDVTVSANGTSTGTNIRNEVVGRLL